MYEKLKINNLREKYLELINYEISIHELIIMTITNVSTDDLFDGTFQQKILDVDKMIFKTKIKLEN
jgi:hypothetical protein